MPVSSCCFWPPMVSTPDCVPAPKVSGGVPTNSSISCFRIATYSMIRRSISALTWKIMLRMSELGCALRIFNPLSTPGSMALPFSALVSMYSSFASSSPQASLSRYSSILA